MPKIEKNKICSRCNTEKDLANYSIIKNRNKYSARCKPCVSEIKKIYRDNNKDKIKKQKHNSYLKNKNTYKEYYKEHEHSIKKRRIQYIKENRDKTRLYDSNRDPKKRKENQKRQYLKRKQNPVFLLRSRISSLINRALKKLHTSKNGESCTKYLKYSFNELKMHLEGLFEPWMSWDNWGTYNPNTWDDNDQSTWTWQIDHIIPISKFKYKTMNDLAFLQCWSLENLRPLSAKINVMDGVNRTRHK